MRSIGNMGIPANVTAAMRLQIPRRRLALGTTGSVSIGTDAVDSVVEQFDDDWVGIDGSNDLDWYRFSVSDWRFAEIPHATRPHLHDRGPGHNQRRRPERLESTTVFIRGKRQRNGGGERDGAGRDRVNLLAAIVNGGGYLARVRGVQDMNQFYQLDVTLRDLPEVGTFADLNLDVAMDVADWQVFLINASVDLTGLRATRHTASRRPGFGRRQRLFRLQGVQVGLQLDERGRRVRAAAASAGAAGAVVGRCVTAGLLAYCAAGGAFNAAR